MPKTLNKAIQDVKGILNKYDRSSTDWFEKAKEEVTSLNDPILTTIFSWSII